MTLTQILQKIRSAFYTKAETDNLLSGKSNTNHNHNSAYLGIKAKAESAKSADSVAWANVSGKPRIPTVNNATLTIQKNGTTVKTFTANSSANVTANIVVPTKTSELTNDSGYITSGDYWSKSATGNQYSHSTFSYLSTIDKATTNTSWSICKPFRIVDKDNSMELGCIEYGYISDSAYIRLDPNHNNGGMSNLTIHNNGISYFDDCRELWLVNKNLGSYNTTPSNEIDTQIWFTDKNSNKYATLQTDYYANGIRHFSLTHKSLRTNN